jgi:hypothetical protein
MNHLLVSLVLVGLAGFPINPGTQKPVVEVPVIGEVFDPPTTLEAMLGRSDAVVIAVLRSVADRPDQARRLALTEYQAEVLATLQDHRRLERNLRFCRPGVGTVEYEDRIVRRFQPGMPELSPGRQFLLFLSWDESSGCYQLAFGPQSLVAFDRNGKLAASGALRELGGLEMSEVVTRVKAARRVVSSSWLDSDQQGSVRNQRLEESEALRRGGIRAAAALTGHYIGMVSAEPENNVESLAQLVDWHDLIVIGRIKSNRGWLTADGETVVTDYLVAVERVLKGDAVSVITVSMPGGRVSFEDGSTATLTSTMRAPLNGERYLLFLRLSWFAVSETQERAANGPIYAPQHLSLGVYYLDQQNRVIPRARPGHPLQKELGRRAEAAVLGETLRLIRAGR